MKSKRRILLSIGVFFILAILVLRPVPRVTESEAISVKGQVIKVEDMGNEDILIRLKDNSKRYYINRGQEQGLDIDNLKSILIGNEVTLKYPKYWTPLDWNNNIRHLSKVETQEQVIFSEFN